ncbi:acyltransferase [candidate division GN15 bacterium]|nr:acyltransferase [candidate division GN15 bacterium]
MKQAVKATLRAIFYVLVLPAGLSTLLVHRLLGSSILFHFFAQAFATAPGAPGVYLRVAFYRQVLKRSHFDVYFAFGSVVTKIDTEFGHRCGVGLYTSVGLASIGDDTVLANYVSILSGRHQHNFEDPDTPILDGENIFNRITIGTNCFVGDKATIMADVGDRTIIGAGAVVIKPIPDYVIAVGNPAKPVKDRKPDEPDNS